MATLRWLANRYLRIDPRSLGLFRILFGLVLMIDLCQRWRWIAAFYSNDGVLPNHAHLFQLRESGRVFSVFHAFSLRDETFAAFCGTLAFYVFFTLGWHTRVFAIASAVALVSLSGRNLLMNGIGDSLAISLLLVSVFLPLGARFSLDSLRHSFRATEERTANDLNDRTTPSPIEVGPSLGALVLVLVVLVLVLAFLIANTVEQRRTQVAVQQTQEAVQRSLPLGIAVMGTLCHSGDPRRRHFRRAAIRS